MTSSYADVPALPPVYLDLPGVMANRIQRGDVTLWSGEGAIGKGQTLIWMAVVTAMQGEHAVLVLPDDKPERDVRPRLDAALLALGGDPECLARIHDLSVLDSGTRFTLDATGKGVGGIPALRQLVDNPAVCVCPPDDPDHKHPVARLVVLDPLFGMLSGSVATEMGARRVLEPLMSMADETGSAIILSQHVVMLNGRPKIAGSTGLRNTARLVYMIERDKLNPAIRVIRTEKSNGAPVSDVRFTLTQQENGMTAVTWLTRDELASRRTAWRNQAAAMPETVPVLAEERKMRAAAADPDRAKVLAWLRATGGGDVAEGAAWTHLRDDQVMAHLAALQAEGLVGTKRRLALSRRH